MPLLRPRDVDDLLERTGIALQGDADRASLGPHGALDRKARPLIVYFAPIPRDAPRVAERFSRVVQAAQRIGAEVAAPEVVHRLDAWLVFVERASGEELCLADWLQLRPSLARRRRVADRLRAAVAAVHAARLAHGSLSPKHVLVGENGEVVLTGLSLRALRDEIDASLAADEDGEALAALLRLLVGEEAEEWTDGGFVPPSLAITGTLTVQTPRAAEVEADTVEVPALRKSSNPPAARASSVPPPRSRASLRPLRESPWRTLALAVLALASVLLLATVVVLARRVRALESANVPVPAPAPSAAPSRGPEPAPLEPPKLSPVAAPPPERERAPEVTVDAASPPVVTSPPRSRRGAPSREKLPHRDLLEDALPLR